MFRSIQHTTIRLRLQRWLPAALALALLLTACSSGGQNRESDGEPTTLKIMYWNEQIFYNDYGLLFYATHPNFDIKIASTSSIQTGEGDYNEKFDEFIRNEKPDILMLTLDQYEKFAADGRLASLESYVADDKFDLEGLIPGLVDLMREKGGGELYGLTPQFSGQAVYYNKDLFDRYNIEYPTDKMSWEEFLNLAGRFPTDGQDEDRIYGIDLGYTASNLHQFGQTIGLTMGLRVVNSADKRVSIDSESWVRAYETALKAFRSGTLYPNDNSDFSGVMTYEDYLFQNPFIAGKVAMTINTTYLLQQLREAANAFPDKAVQNWDLVTIPVDPANPDYTHDTPFYSIFAINAESANRDAAWEFIRYIHGDEFAQVRSKTFAGQLPVRTKYIQDSEGRNMAAFYMLKPSSSSLFAGIEDMPQDFSMQYYTIGTEEMQAVMDDRKSVAEALASMQTRLQAALDASLANQDSGGASAIPGGTGASTGIDADEAAADDAGEDAVE